MAIYTSKFTQQEIDDGIDNANNALQPTALNNYYDKDAINDFLDDKQDTLVSGTNIKTVNNNSLLGSGNLSITKSDVGLENVGNFKAVSTAASQGLSNTEKSNARSNIGAGTSSFSGSYNDLTDKPTIPSVGNAEVEIQKNGTKVGSFTTNQSGSKVAVNITVPTGTAANKDVPTSGNASTSQVVMGNDSRLTDSRNANDVYSWAKASSKPTYTASEVGAIPTSAKGAASGVATLDSAGKVPSSQLPSYVDDVLEYNTKSAFPTTGEGGKIYVDKSNNTTWRWSGSSYTQIKGDLTIGTTSGTAADGKVVNDHINNTSNPHGVTKAQVGLGSVVNTGDSATPVSGGTTKFTTGGAYTELNKKVDKVDGKGLSTNDYTTNEKNKLGGIASGAEVNQNAFSNVGVKVGNTTTTVAADAKTDTVTLIQGSNVTLTTDTTNDTITIAAKDTTYSSKAAASGGSDVSLVTTGEKYTWNNKSNFSGSYNDLTNKPTIPSAANNGTYTVKTLIGSTTTNVSDFTANQSGTDDVTFVQGSNVTITPDATNRKITISATDTKNTAGTTNKTGTKIFLVAATNQSANPVTYSNSDCYIGTDNCLYSGGAKVLTSHQDISEKADKSTTVNTVLYDTSNKKITKTINGSTTDVVTAAKIVTDGGGITDISEKADKSTTVSTVTYDTTNKKIRKTINGTTSDVVTAATIVTDGGGVKGIIVGSGSALTPSSGNVTIPAYPTTLPASDVYDWAKAETKPTYTASEVGLGNVGNFKAVSTVASQGLSSTEKSNARANIGAGTSSFSGSYNDLTNKPTLGAAAAKGVTDNSSSKAVTSTDTNLITARTLYYAGYTKNVGTITGITMNGASKGTSGVVDLGTVITSHQDISGKQDKVAKLGSSTKPLYTSAAGTFAECSTYAGGTAVTLNGSSKAESTASFYAPTSAGTAGQLLMSTAGAPSWRTGDIVHYVTSVSGTTGTKSSNRSIWNGTVDGITELYTGLTVQIKIPVAGVNVGIVLNINGLGEHPIVHNVDSLVTTHYAVGTILTLIYDAEQTASVTVSGTATSITGCWKLRLYDANTTYSAGTLAILEAGTNTTNRVWQAKIIADYVKATPSPANGGNADTVGGFTVGVNVPADAVFTDNDTTYKLNINGTDQGGGSTSLGTVYAPTSAGTEGQMLIANSSGAPVWTNFPTIPSKMSDVAVMSVSAISSDTSSSCSITGAGNTGKSETIVYTNSSGADLTVTVPTTYATPDGAAIELTCPNGGYCEVNYLNIGGTIYARGL